MNQPNAKLVEVRKARDTWEGTLLTGYLRDNGIEAAFQGDPNVSFDMTELLRNSDEAFGIFVLEPEAARAKALLTEFLTAATDESLLSENAAHKLKVDQATIYRLRGALVEERRTFEFLGWLCVIFLGAAALLWTIWPAWLKMDVPPAIFRWLMVGLLTLGAVFAGNWASRKI
ncbi:MAG: hypothetical protein WCG79_00595 [Verrucomicrobiota bacterium]|jgi:hypothetical protein